MPKIVRNGDESDYVVWSTVEKAMIGLVFTLLGSGVVGAVAIAFQTRETAVIVGLIRETTAEIKESQRDHVRESDATHYRLENRINSVDREIGELHGNERLSVQPSRRR